MNYCQKCVMPDTKPGVTLDEKGLCNACRTQINKRKIDWEQRQKWLAELCEEIKISNNGAYDCLVPVSGGKDGFYQAYTMRNLGMKVLCVTLASHMPTTEGIFNLNNHINQLDVDHIKVTLKHSVYKNIRKKTFLKRGEPNWAEHLTIFSSVANIAKLYEVPLIIWGEDIAVEFGGMQNTTSKPDAIDIGTNDLIGNSTIDDWLDQDISKRDVFFYKYPPLEDLKRIGVRAIYLSYYHFWDGFKHFKVAEKHGFKSRAAGPLSGNFLAYDNIDEKLCEINIWLKYIKFGFWRTTDQTCYHIWNDHLSRDDAVDIIDEIQSDFPKEYFDDFLRFHGITLDQFWNTVEKFRNMKIWEKHDNKYHLKNPIQK
jgi:N-acetyl sugar amidotransferase